MKRWLLLIVLCAGAVFAVPRAFAGDVGLLGVGVGVSGVFESGNHWLGSVEWQAGRGWIGPFSPWATVATTGREAGYVGAGVALDWPLSRHWLLIPSFGPVLYWRGHGTALGELLEFRSRIELAYVFDHDQRLGLSIAHISNGGLDDYNPGTQTAELIYSHPL